MFSQDWTVHPACLSMFSTQRFLLRRLLDMFEWKESTVTERTSLHGGILLTKHWGDATSLEEAACFNTVECQRRLRHISSYPCTAALGCLRLPALVHHAGAHDQWATSIKGLYVSRQSFQRRSSSLWPRQIMWRNGRAIVHWGGVTQCTLTALLCARKAQVSMYRTAW
jgi:hypothetical protein